MFYTSYYAKYRKYKGFYRIAISRTSPCNTKEPISYDEKIIQLAPSKDILADYKYNGLSKEQYTERYIDQLDNLRSCGTLDDIVKYLRLLTSDITSDIVFLCYEKSDDFCHRHILADYLNKHYDFCIREL